MAISLQDEKRGIFFREKVVITSNLFVNQADLIIYEATILLKSHWHIEFSSELQTYSKLMKTYYFLTYFMIDSINIDIFITYQISIFYPLEQTIISQKLHEHLHGLKGLQCAVYMYSSVMDLVHKKYTNSFPI